MVRFFTDEKEKKNGDVGNHKHRKLYDYYSSGAIVSGARSSPQNIAVKAQHAERWNNKMKKMNEGCALMVLDKRSPTDWKYVSAQ